MTYRIRRAEWPGETVFVLSGEMDAEHASRLEHLLSQERERSILLDLGEVTLVARDAVRFLASVEARGIRIVNCPQYVRSWIAAEGSAPTERPA